MAGGKLDCARRSPTHGRPRGGCAQSPRAVRAVVGPPGGGAVASGGGGGGGAAYSGGGGGGGGGGGRCDRRLCRLGARPGRLTSLLLCRLVRFLLLTLSARVGSLASRARSGQDAASATLPKDRPKMPVAGASWRHTVSRPCRICSRRLDTRARSDADVPQGAHRRWGRTAPVETLGSWEAQLDTYERRRDARMRSGPGSDGTAHRCK